MKQSIKALKTKFNPPLHFGSFIETDRPGKLMIAHCHELPEKSRIDSIYSKGEDAVILIGPEGDFSNEEVSLASGRGFKSIHLGSSRLRTETAGLAACHSVYFINQ